MKKLYIFIAFMSLTLAFVIFIAVLSKEKPTIKLTTFEKAYSYVSDDEDTEEILVNIYINQKDSYLIKAGNIKNSYISDIINENYIKLNLRRVDYESRISFNNETYYLYSFVFTIVLSSENDFSIEIDNAYISIDYLQEESIKISIGSFSYYKVSKFGSEDISISKLRGIVNEVQGVKTLVALEIGFKNNTTQNITIKGVYPLDVNIKISNSDISVLTSYGYPASEPLKNILGYDYNPKSQIFEQIIEILIKPIENIEYIFPLKYVNDLPSNRIGFMVEYEINQEIRYLYYDDFTFFSNHRFTNTEISKLIFYTYENH